MGKEDVLTLEKLRIYERLAQTEAQLGAIKTLVEELHQQRPSEKKETSGSPGKVLGVGALLATVLVAVVAPIHQKIDFTERQQDNIKLDISQNRNSLAFGQTEIAKIAQRFVEVETQFKNLDERTNRIESRLNEQIQHINDLVSVRQQMNELQITNAAELIKTRIDGEIKASEAIHKVIQEETHRVKERIQNQENELRRIEQEFWAQKKNGGL